MLDTIKPEPIPEWSEVTVSSAHDESHLNELEGRPSLRSMNLARLERLRCALRSSTHHEHAARWADTLLRLCELKRSGVKSAIGDHGSASEREVAFRLLLIFFLEVFQLRSDARFVNTTLKLLGTKWTAEVNRARTTLRRGGGDLTSSVLVIVTNTLLASALDKISSDRFCPLAEAAQPGPEIERGLTLKARGAHVVVFSPSRYSLYTVAVMALLQKAGVNIDAVIVRRIGSIDRFRSEFRRDGKRLLFKIWHKLLRRNASYANVAHYPRLPDLLRELDVQESTVHGLARRHRIPEIACGTLNDIHVHRALDSFQPDLVVFTGGGIVRPETLRRSGYGVVNCHMGQLPAYRGMDVVEWALLEHHPELVGFTVHFMNEGIDTGDILSLSPITVEREQDIAALRQKFEYPMACGLVDSTVAFLNGAIHRQPQKAEAGKQYFIIHPELHSLARSAMSAASQR